MRQLQGLEHTDWSTEPEASFSPEQFQANECTFFLWPRYSLVSRPPGQSLWVRSMLPRAAATRRRDAERVARTWVKKSGQFALTHSAHDGICPHLRVCQTVHTL